MNPIDPPHLLDAINAQVDGIVTGYVAVATYFDAEGRRGYRVVSMAGQGPHDTLGLLHMGVISAQDDISAMFREG